MVEAYAPGLIVTELTRIKKERRLPLRGEVIVNLGDKVECDTIVAKTMIPGNVKELDVARIIGIDAGPKEMGGEQVSNYMSKKKGDSVIENEVIAKLESFFGLFKKECVSPMNGTIENISDLTGKILIRSPSVPLELEAYIPGEVVEKIPNEGVVIESISAVIQGIFGIGGETYGPISICVEKPTEILSEDIITPEHKGKIIVGGN